MVTHGLTPYKAYGLRTYKKKFQKLFKNMKIIHALKNTLHKNV